MFFDNVSKNKTDQGIVKNSGKNTNKIKNSVKQMFRILI